MHFHSLAGAATLLNVAAAQILVPEVVSGSAAFPALYPVETTGLPQYRFSVQNAAELSSKAQDVAAAAASWLATVTTGPAYAAYVSDLPSAIASDLRAATDIDDLLNLSTYPTSFWSTFPESAKSYHSEVWDAQRSFIAGAAQSEGGLVVPARPTVLPSVVPGNAGGGGVSTAGAPSNSVVHTQVSGGWLMVAAAAVGVFAVLL